MYSEVESDRHKCPWESAHVPAGLMKLASISSASSVGCFSIRGQGFGHVATSAISTICCPPYPPTLEPRSGAAPRSTEGESFAILGCFVPMLLHRFDEGKDGKEGNEICTRAMR